LQQTIPQLLAQDEKIEISIPAGWQYKGEAERLPALTKQK